MQYDYLVVGAGLCGSVCAQQMAETGKRVLLIDKRQHVGGNAYDVLDAHGVFVHPYGPHIFHTNSKKIFAYLSRFTAWLFYEHRVLAYVNHQFLPIPINRTTINLLYGLNLDEPGVAEFFEKVREPRETIRSSEDVVLNSVGKDLCDKFFRNYTRKQWGLDLSELSAGVAARIPTRTNDDDRYFTDVYQFMPADGYTKMVERMLSSPLIDVRLSTDYTAAAKDTAFKHLIYTGPIDAFFGCCFGPLPYRSLYFEHEHLSGQDFYQRVGTINYPNDHDYTRITEFKHLTGQRHAGTSIVREYPRAEGDPYYPIPCQDSEELFKRYEALARQRDDVTFVGRLAQYRYYNMDQVVGAALQAAEQLKARR